MNISVTHRGGTLTLKVGGNTIGSLQISKPRFVSQGGFGMQIIQGTGGATVQVFQTSPNKILGTKALQDIIRAGSWNFTA